MRAMAKAVISVAVLMLLVMGGKPVGAETITIGKGSGIVWEGMPFSGTLSGPMVSARLVYDSSLVAITSNRRYCSSGAWGTATINGISGFTVLSEGGVILVPRMKVDGYFTRYNGETVTFGGTIGPPENTMYTSAGINMDMGYGPWCFGPEGYFRGRVIEQYYSPTGPRVVNYSGNWVLIADGTQKNSLQSPMAPWPFYITSSTDSGWGQQEQLIFPNTINLRVSTLACTVATPTAINFGNVQRNSQSGAELARLTYPLNTACTQSTQAADRISANINVQFRAQSGQYNATPSWLALTQGGGYITGEIDNGVTGSGACGGTGGIPFDSTQLKVGSITSAETSKATSNNVTWRLCSGGAALPLGPVDASAEMLVTFN